MNYSCTAPSTVHVVSKQPDHLFVEPQLSQGIRHALNVYGAVIAEENIASLLSGGELNQRDHRAGDADPSVVATLQKNKGVTSSSFTIAREGA